MKKKIAVTLLALMTLCHLSAKDYPASLFDI
jgi:hypothetical protein